MADNRRIFSYSGIDGLDQLANAIEELTETKIAMIQTERQQKTHLVDSSSQTASSASAASASISSSSSVATGHSGSSVRTFPVSDASQAMLNAVLELIQFIKLHNSIDFFLIQSNRDKLSALVSKIDLGSGTYTPKIFNEQSFQLALLQKKWLDDLNLDEHIANFDEIQSLLKPFLNIQETLDQVKKHVRLGCELYQLALMCPVHYRWYSDQKTLTQTQCESWLKALEDNLISNHNENIKKFSVEYTNTIKNFLQSIAKMPYVRIANSNTLTDQAQDYAFGAENLVLVGMRANLFQILLDYEKQINLRLKEKNQPLMTEVYVFLKAQYGQVAYEALLAEFGNIVSEAQDLLEKYKTGDHLRTTVDLGFWKPSIALKTVSKDKIKIFETCCDQLQKIQSENEKAIGEKIWSAVGAVLNALNQNQEVVSDKKIALGELSKTLSGLLSRLFVLRFEKLDETCDDWVAKKLDGYEKDLGLQSSFAVENAALVSPSASEVHLEVIGVDALESEEKSGFRM